MMTSKQPVTTKRNVLKRIAIAMKNVNAEIRANASRGGHAAGLASEGCAGGYIAALRDVDAALTHGYVNCNRHYWDETQ